METNSSLNTYEEFGGEGEKQEISSTGGTCLLSVIHNLLCDCMSLQMGAFPGDQIPYVL